jgi:hypothetical protein
MEFKSLKSNSQHNFKKFSRKFSRLSFTLEIRSETHSPPLWKEMPSSHHPTLGNFSIPPLESHLTQADRLASLLGDMSDTYTDPDFIPLLASESESECDEPLALQIAFRHRGAGRGRSAFSRQLRRAGLGPGRAIRAPLVSHSTPPFLVDDYFSPSMTHANSTSDPPGRQTYEDCLSLLDTEVGSFFYRYSRRSNNTAMAQSMVGSFEAACTCVVCSLEFEHLSSP